MAKLKKRTSKSRDAYPKLPVETQPAQQVESHTIRETVESIVIAFVLAFLFRTFEAEAFVIPTGSMAPTLMGRHKDVDCPKCGHRFRISSSEEEGGEVEKRISDVGKLHLELARPENQRADHQLAIRRRIDELRREIPLFHVIGGVCPICRYSMPVREDISDRVLGDRSRDEIEDQKSYTGDRILVNKYLYTFSDPRRWDVVVFHFPGDAKVNYIKRLVGLPGEVIRVYQGDLFVAENPGLRRGDRLPNADFAIVRKPPDKVLSMRQLVHDTDYDPAELYEARWPLRWRTTGDEDSDGWQVDAEVDGLHVRQRFTVDSTEDEAAWLRYQHSLPGYDDWQRIERLHGEAVREPGSAAVGAAARPQLVTDFNSYNTRITRHQARQAARGQAKPQGLRPAPSKLGIHWVGDLMFQANVEIETARGELLLDLVEAGQHFTCSIDLATGRATLGIDSDEEFSPTADTALTKPGRYRVALANVDDQLHVWVDGKLVKFDGSTQYDANRVFGGRDAIIPRTSDADLGDLAPAGIGARDAKLSVTRLQLWRDIYYIADSWQRQPRSQVVTDFNRPFDEELYGLPSNPSMWNRFGERNQVQFPLEADQYFVMGDNSPESSDARLWLSGSPSGGRPGGAYLERRMLIGKALCVYWPHSWNRIIGTPIPFPFFPNFADVRLVR